MFSISHWFQPENNGDITKKCRVKYDDKIIGYACLFTYLWHFLYQMHVSLYFSLPSYNYVYSLQIATQCIMDGIRQSFVITGVYFYIRVLRDKGGSNKTRDNQKQKLLRFRKHDLTFCSAWEIVTYSPISMKHYEYLSF